MNLKIWVFWKSTQYSVCLSPVAGDVLLYGLLLPQILWCFLFSSGFSLAAAAAEKLFQHSELKKEQASLAWVEIPFSAILYLSIAPAPSPDEIRKVGQWRAKEGCSTGMLEAGREADEGVEERWKGGELYTEDISPCLKPDSRHLLSWFDFLLCCSSSL